MLLPHLRHLMVVTVLSLLATASVHAKDNIPPHVLVSIKPLQLIAAAITDNITTPELLLPPGSSPHSYSLRPSDVRKLAAADLVFWIGPDMESFLPKVLKRHVDEGKAIALMNSQGIKLSELLTTEGGEEHNHDHNHGHNHNHGHDRGHAHEHGTHDPHIWLDPNNVIVMAQVMMQKLSSLDSSNRDKYESNYKKFVTQMKVTDRDNKELLRGVGEQGFFVFHDAWGYLTRHYNLSVADVFTISPTQAPGARHMASLRRQLKEQSHQSCVFREPQFQPGYLDVLIDDLQIKVDVLDPLSADIAVTPDGYSRYLNGIASTIHRCLSSAKKIAGGATSTVATKD